MTSIPPRWNPRGPFAEVGPGVLISPPRIKRPAGSTAGSPSSQPVPSEPKRSVLAYVHGAAKQDKLTEPRQVTDVGRLADKTAEA
jgi:hypothetical protein